MGQRLGHPPTADSVRTWGNYGRDHASGPKNWTLLGDFLNLYLPCRYHKYRLYRSRPSLIAVGMGLPMRKHELHEKCRRYGLDTPCNESVSMRVS